jgi:type VI secretion system protein ImpF
MAADYLSREVTPSLLDRLIDLDPESRHETPVTEQEQIREFRAALCRDLTALLNTRRAAQDFDAGYVEAANSLLTFGVIDFTSHSLRKGTEQEQLRVSMERAIRQFEPRLERVSVSVEEADAQRLLLRLEITANLRTEAGDPVVFDATVHRDSRRVAVTGGV